MGLQCSLLFGLSAAFLDWQYPRRCQQPHNLHCSRLMYHSCLGTSVAGVPKELSTHQNDDLLESQHVRYFKIGWCLCEQITWGIYMNEWEEKRPALLWTLLRRHSEWNVNLKTLLTALLWLPQSQKNLFDSWKNRSFVETSEWQNIHLWIPCIAGIPFSATLQSQSEELFCMKPEQQRMETCWT